MESKEAGAEMNKKRMPPSSPRHSYWTSVPPQHYEVCPSGSAVLASTTQSDAPKFCVLLNFFRAWTMTFVTMFPTKRTYEGTQSL